MTKFYIGKADVNGVHPVRDGDDAIREAQAYIDRRPSKLDPGQFPVARNSREQIKHAQIANRVETNRYYAGLVAGGMPVHASVNWDRAEHFKLGRDTGMFPILPGDQQRRGAAAREIPPCPVWGCLYGDPSLH